MAEKITAKQYAERVGISGATVTRHLNAKTLPGIVKAEKFGNTWQITIGKTFIPVELKKKFRNNLVV